VRTVRRECTDHVLIFGARHLEGVLSAYLQHYNSHRPHRGLGLVPPVGRPEATPHGDVIRRDVLGGLIHEYRRAA
jgi:hypothetical protein